LSEELRLKIEDGVPDSADTGAIEMLYRPYGAALVLLAAAITGKRSRAQDAVHQVFLRLLERAGLDRGADPKAYPYASFRKVILNDLWARERDLSIENESIWFDPPNRDHAASRYRYAPVKLRETLDFREEPCAISHDEQFERYLRRFKPLAADPRLRSIRYLILLPAAVAVPGFAQQRSGLSDNAALRYWTAFV
jgi:DNA-directed RNA polymerase specialized sigma24 family protein